MSVALLNETFVHPHDLLDSTALPGTKERQWQVLYTKARHEKAVARQLQVRGIPFYLPLIDKTAVCRGRRVSSRVPLFPGYVFLYGDADERRQSLETNRVSQVFDVPSCDELLWDLRQIQQLIAARTPLSSESRLAPGQRVRVKHGSFQGLEGTVVMRRGETRLVISVEFLQRGASVAIDDFMVEAI